MSGGGRAVTQGLAVGLTLAVVLVVASGIHTTMRLAQSSREAIAENSKLVQALAQATLGLAEQQRLMTDLQNRVTAFSDEQVRGRRAQGARARQLIELCSKGQLRGAICAHLPDEALLEQLER